MGALKPGTVVIVKKYAESPEFWDSDGNMMCYSGKMMTIKGDTACGNYSLVEDGGRWIWRAVDLLVLPGYKTSNNPNISFKLNKGRNRHANR